MRCLRGLFGANLCKGAYLLRLCDFNITLTYVFQINLFEYCILALY